MREPARRYRGGALVLVLAGALLLAACSGGGSSSSGTGSTASTSTSSVATGSSSTKTTSITISNQKVQSRVKNDATDTATTVSKTYQISALTDIEVDGASANVSALHAGMFVEISADPPSDLGPADETNGGLARTINAHENNGTPPPK